MENFLVAIIVLLIGGIGWLVRHEKEKRSQIEAQLSQEKYQTYMLFVDTLFGVFHDDALEKAKLKRSSNKSIVPDLQKFSKRVIFYGSDEVIREFQKFKDVLANPETALAEKTESMGHVMTAIRRDMGHPDTKFNPKTLARQMLNDYTENTAPGKEFHDFNQKYPDI